MSERDGWCTPQPIVDFICEIWPGGVDFDPCSNEHSLIAARIELYEADDIPPDRRLWAPYLADLSAHNGLGHVPLRLWCNPPYSDILPWATAVADAAIDVDAMMLVPLDPTTRWWRVLKESSDLLILPHKRVNFDPPPGVKKSSNRVPSAIFYFGNTSARIVKIASKLGDCYVRRTA